MMVLSMRDTWMMRVRGRRCDEAMKQRVELVRR